MRCWNLCCFVFSFCISIVVVVLTHVALFGVYFIYVLIRVPLYEVFFLFVLI